MKIYTNREEYENDFKYWSNACGDLLHDGRWIEESELPEELKTPYNNLFSESTGSYCYLCEYKNQYGIALINEYHEFSPEGKPWDKYNFKSAIQIAQILESEMKDSDMHISDIFIGKEMGFTGTTPDNTEGDYATELVVFMDYQTTKEQFNKVADWLLKNAYDLNEYIIKKTCSEVSREKSAEFLAKILMSDEISTYKMYEELAEKFLEGNEDCKKGINLACAAITGYDFFELSEKLLKEN